jgi:hypothetical protein
MTVYFTIAFTPWFQQFSYIPIPEPLPLLSNKLKVIPLIFSDPLSKEISESSKAGK